MRVLLISANTEMLPDPVAPLGPACVASALRKAGHDTRFLDLCFIENMEAAVRETVSDFRPDCIGVSLRNLDNVAFPDSVSYLPFYKKIAETCRRVSAAPVFLGGAGFTLMPGPILEYLGADGGIAGEGEESFPALLSSGGNCASVQGFWKKGQDRPAGSACIRDLDALPSPCWEGLDLEQYFLRGGMGNLQTKRGCPFSCVYCTYPLIEGRQVRLRSPERAAADAEFLASKGVENIFVVDNIFNFPRDHAREVCRCFTGRKLSLSWSCYAHPLYFDEELARDMKEAGCTGVEFGIDSGARRVLTALRKDFAPEDIRRACLAARGAGLEVCCSVSLGAPGESPETLDETFSLLAEIQPTAVVAMAGLRIFPGTGLEKIAAAEGAMSPSANLLEPVFYISPAVKDRILDICREQAALRPNWIFPGLGINVTRRLQSKLRKIGVRGPLWEHMKILRRGKQREEPGG